MSPNYIMTQEKDEIVANDSYDLIEEVHTRIDALLELLEEKGLVYEAEMVKKLEEMATKEERNSEE
jgi:hypothetical protein